MSVSLNSTSTLVEKGINTEGDATEVGEETSPQNVDDSCMTVKIIQSRPCIVCGSVLMKDDIIYNDDMAFHLRYYVCSSSFIICIFWSW